VRISLGTDAHHPWQLAFMNFSLAAPLLTEINRDRILNFMPVDELRAWVESVRRDTSKRLWGRLRLLASWIIIPSR
jgi:hypothetical protein